MPRGGAGGGVAGKEALDEGGVEHVVLGSGKGWSAAPGASWSLLHLTQNGILCKKELNLKTGFFFKKNNV